MDVYGLKMGFFQWQSSGNFHGFSVVSSLGQRDAKGLVPDGLQAKNCFRNSPARSMHRLHCDLRCRHASTKLYTRAAVGPRIPQAFPVQTALVHMTCQNCWWVLESSCVLRMDTVVRSENLPHPTWVRTPIIFIIFICIHIYYIYMYMLWSVRLIKRDSPQEPWLSAVFPQGPFWLHGGSFRSIWPSLSRRPAGHRLRPWGHPPAWPWWSGPPSNGRCHSWRKIDAQNAFSFFQTWAHNTYLYMKYEGYWRLMYVNS